MILNDLLTEAGAAPIYYFAYGMLTDPEIMQAAEFVGAATLPNFNFEFRGYANVYPGRGSAQGVLWVVSREFLSNLDRTEGYPYLYDRKTVPVMANGQRYEAFVYTMTPESAERMEGRVPTQSYLRLLVNGYDHAGLPLTQIKQALDQLVERETQAWDGEDDVNESHKLGNKHLKTIENFIHWVYKKKRIPGPLPHIRFQSHKESPRQHRTGYYNKDTNELWVYTGHRNFIDILRTLAHELTHRKQGEQGRIHKKSPPGSPLEREADSEAGRLMKLYVRLHPEIID